MNDRLDMTKTLINISQEKLTDIVCKQAAALTL